MITPRETVKAGLTLIIGGKPATPPPSPMVGFMTTFNTETCEPGGFGRVAVTPRPDGSFVVRPLREGVSAWQD